MIKHDVYTVSVESAGDEDGGSADNMYVYKEWIWSSGLGRWT